LTDPAGRAAIGLVGALIIGVISAERRALTRKGSATAVLLGATCAAAGWIWAALLLAFFFTGTVLSRMAADTKAEHTRGIVEKDGNRDHVQVLANGGLFSLLALCSLLFDNGAFLFPAAGAIAASTADTWSTETGTAASGSARSLLGFREVQAGTSGAVSAAGTLAAIAGAIFIAGIALAFGGSGRLASAAIAGGIGGSFLDSLAGATIQAQRWCGQCGKTTERMTHTCGSTTEHKRGIRWLDNDAVNALAGVGGALIGTLFLL
jgi:uncharacterized protein (TIGR00297 family)